MKLRIKGDSIRLRLTRQEVEAVGQGLAVKEAARFPGGTSLRYQLMVAVDDSVMSARFTEGLITVYLERQAAAQWSAGPAVGIERVLPLPGGGELRVLVEKDFECLHPSHGDRIDGTYPNPSRSAVP